MTSPYLIEIYNPDGDRLADISALCLTRSYSVRRNRPEDIYLTMNLESAQRLAMTLGLGFYQLYAAGVNEIRITRGNRPMVGGQLMYVHPRLNQEGATLELRASGFLDLLSKRFLTGGMVNSTVTNQDMGLSAWQLIDESQHVLNDPANNFGITQGVLQTSRNITQTWQTWQTNAQSLKEIIIGLTEREAGIDIEFTPDKVFNVYYPGIGMDKTELLFSYPGNITNIGAPQDATTLINYSITRGEGNGDAQMVAVADNLASRTTYKTRHGISDYPSISEAATLQEKANETIRLYSTPTMVPSITLDGSQEPYLGAYWIGDSVRFSVDTDRYPAFALLDGQTWRINEISCELDENDHEDITLKVGY